MAAGFWSNHMKNDWNIAHGASWYEPPDPVYACEYCDTVCGEDDLQLIEHASIEALNKYACETCHADHACATCGKMQDDEFAPLCMACWEAANPETE